MAIPVSLARKRGNPNRGRPIPYAPALPTEFEVRVSQLQLAMAETKNPGLVKEVMGHESLSTTMGYLHPETAQFKIVIDRLNQQKNVM